MVTGHEFKKPDDHIHNILQDPTGQHLLVCFKSSQECYYITRNAKKPRQLNKMKVGSSSCDPFVHSCVIIVDVNTKHILLNTYEHPINKILICAEYNYNQIKSNHTF